MTRVDMIERLDPVDIAEAARVVTLPAFAQLLDSITSDPDEHHLDSASLPRLGRSKRPMLFGSLAAATILVAGVVVVVNGRSEGASSFTTAYQTGHPYVGSHPSRGGTWKLLDASITGTWQQSLSGPPPGYLDCPTARACFTMSAKYANDHTATIESESLYASDDLGVTWTEFPMPQGFSSTSSLACANATTCAAGGTYKGQPVFAATIDGGHTFAIDPLPAGAGGLYAISCPTSTFCGGLAATATHGDSYPVDASFVSTTDGGATFTASPIALGDSMRAIDCPTANACTAIGTDDAFGVDDWTSAVAGSTTDGGAIWTVSAMPAGFGVSYLSQISCGDATHCAATGNVAATIANPPQCFGLIAGSLPTVGTTTTIATPVTTPNPAVQAISASESAIATAENQHQASVKAPSGFSCGSNIHTTLSDIATTDNGGKTWTPEPMPTNVPHPDIYGISCPSASECWAAGDEAVPQGRGNVQSSSSSVLLGTTDGGATWSKVTFNLPTSGSNYEGQAYLAIGNVSCPTINVCGALGVGAQGAPTTPMYSLLSPTA